MTITVGQGQSEITPYKQQDYEHFLDFWFGLVKTVQSGKNGRRFRKTIIYIDTNAGCGYNHEWKIDGSPVIFCKKAEEYNIPYYAHCIDKNDCYTTELAAKLTGFNAKVYTGDNNEILPQLLDKLPPSSLGLIYTDPNGIPPWSLLQKASKHPVTSSIDILIRYNTLATKRNHHYGYNLEKDRLKVSKKIWFAKEYYSFDRWAWSFLLGMNYPFKDWKRQGWKRLDTPTGQDLKDRLTYTKKQLQKKRQSRLTGLIENTCATPNLELFEHKLLSGQMESVKDAIINLLQKFTT